MAAYTPVLDDYVSRYFNDVEGFKKAVLETQRTTPQLYVVQGSPMQNHAFIQIMSNIVDYSYCFQWAHASWDMTIGAPCRFMVMSESYNLPLIADNVSGPVWVFTDGSIPDDAPYQVFKLLPTATSISNHSDPFFEVLYAFLKID